KLLFYLFILNFSKQYFAFLYGVALGDDGIYKVIPAYPVGKVEFTAEGAHFLREYGIEKDGEGGGNLQADMQGIGTGLGIFFSCFPGLGIGKVFISNAGKLHRFADRFAHLKLLISIGNFIFLFLYLCQHVTVIIRSII